MSRNYGLLATRGVCAWAPHPVQRQLLRKGITHPSALHLVHINTFPYSIVFSLLFGCGFVLGFGLFCGLVGIFVGFFLGVLMGLYYVGVWVVAFFFFFFYIS